jgi:hypothetical protein
MKQDLQIACTMLKPRPRSVLLKYITLPEIRLQTYASHSAAINMNTAMITGGYWKKSPAKMTVIPPNHSSGHSVA